MFRALTLVAAALLAAPAVAQTTRHVPQQYLTIQAAVDAATDGDTILIAAGTYPESVSIEARAGLVVLGLGQVVIAPPAGAGLYLGQCSGCTVENIRVLGGEPGFRINQTTGSVLLKCRVQDAKSDGIRLRGGSDNSVLKCVVEGAASRSIAVVDDAGSYPSNVTLSRCKVLGGHEGILLQGQNHLVERCRVVDSEGYGIATGGADVCSNILITRCKVVRPGTDGIAIGGESLVVDACTVVRSSGFGIVDTTGHLDFIRDCRVKHAGTIGIGCFQLSVGVAVVGCHVSGSGDQGLLLHGKLHHVEGNKVCRSEDDGVELEASSCALLDNKVSGNDGNGIVLVDGGNNTFSGNVVHGNEGFDLLDLAGDQTNLVDDTNDFGTVGP